MVFSFVQIRGSVPLFWEETGQPFGSQIAITRPLASSLPAFQHHLNNLIEEYSTVHILNLLSSKDQEAVLTDAFQLHLRSSEQRIKDHTTMTTFDFHARSQIGGIESVTNQLLSSVRDKAESMGSCLMGVDEKTGSLALVIPQKGAVSAFSFAFQRTRSRSTATDEKY